jgi:hypothetical protein
MDVEALDETASFLVPTLERPTPQATVNQLQFNQTSVNAIQMVRRRFAAAIKHGNPFQPLTPMGLPITCGKRHRPANL